MAAASPPAGYTGPSTKDDAREGRLKLNVNLEEVRSACAGWIAEAAGYKRRGYDWV